MPQSSICHVSRHSLVHVFPWIQCTGCMHNDHMVVLCECILCMHTVHYLGSVLVRPNFYLVDVCIMNCCNWDSCDFVIGPYPMITHAPPQVL